MQWGAALLTEKIEITKFENTAFFFCFTTVVQSPINIPRVVRESLITMKEKVGKDRKRKNEVENKRRKKKRIKKERKEK